MSQYFAFSGRFADKDEMLLHQPCSSNKIHANEPKGNENIPESGNNVKRHATELWPTGANDENTIKSSTQKQSSCSVFLLIRHLISTVLIDLDVKALEIFALRGYTFSPSVWQI